MSGEGNQSGHDFFIAHFSCYFSLYSAFGITIISCYYLKSNCERKRALTRMHYLPDDYYVGEEAGKSNASGPFHIDCAFCNGTGVHPATMNILNHSQCPACSGSGWLHFTGSRKDFKTCPQCQGAGRGTGFASINPCNKCKGKGII
jgi:hypothetical protein